MDHTFNYYRKLWHMAGLIVPVTLYFDLFAFLEEWFFQPSRGVLILLSVISIPILFFLDLWRFRSPAFAAFVERILGAMMKQEERGRFTGIIPYLIANTLLLLFMGQDVVILSMILLSIGDPAAAFFGQVFGKHRFSNGKSLEGSMAFLSTGLVSCLLFLYISSLNPGSGKILLFAGEELQVHVLMGVVAATLVAAIAEIFSGTALKGLLDDNLLVPMSAALTMVGAGYFFFGLDLSILLTDFLQIF